jgi:hypothetical protein
VSPFFSTILKNNITAQLVRQEIVGFSFRASTGRSGRTAPFISRLESGGDAREFTSVDHSSRRARPLGVPVSS